MGLCRTLCAQVKGRTPQATAANSPPRATTASSPPRATAASSPPRAAAANSPPRATTASSPPRAATAEARLASKPGLRQQARRIGQLRQPARRLGLRQQKARRLGRLTASSPPRATAASSPPRAKLRLRRRIAWINFASRCRRGNRPDLPRRSVTASCCLRRRGRNQAGRVSTTSPIPAGWSDAGLTPITRHPERSAGRGWITGRLHEDRARVFFPVGATRGADMRYRTAQEAPACAGRWTAELRPSPGLCDLRRRRDQRIHPEIAEMRRSQALQADAPAVLRRRTVCDDGSPLCSRRRLRAKRDSGFRACAVAGDWRTPGLSRC